MKTENGKREELVYGIYENELDSLSSHNTISTTCFSEYDKRGGKNEIKT